MIEIEKNVPMPQGRGLSGRFPFGDMKVGDGFGGWLIGGRNVLHTT